jgi:hypothetical protein
MPINEVTVMAGTNYDAALAEATRLDGQSDDQLFEELGLRLQDVMNPGGYERVQHYSGKFTHAAKDLGFTDDLKEFGRRWWLNLEPEILGFVCNKNDADRDALTKGKTIPQIAASLATAGVVSAFGPPAWVIVATSIVAAKLADTGVKTVCQMWQEAIKGRSSSSTHS